MKQPKPIAPHIGLTKAHAADINDLIQRRCRSGGRIRRNEWPDVTEIGGRMRRNAQRKAWNVEAVPSSSTRKAE